MAERTLLDDRDDLERALVTANAVANQARQDAKAAAKALEEVQRKINLAQRLDPGDIDLMTANSPGDREAMKAVREKIDEMHPGRGPSQTLGG